LDPSVTVTDAVFVPELAYDFEAEAVYPEYESESEPVKE
jgi:hypothetical protein